MITFICFIFEDGDSKKFEYVRADSEQAAKNYMIKKHSVNDEDLFVLAI